MLTYRRGFIRAKSPSAEVNRVACKEKREAEEAGKE